MLPTHCIVCNNILIKNTGRIYCNSTNSVTPHFRCNIFYKNNIPSIYMFAIMFFINDKKYLFRSVYGSSSKEYSKISIHEIIKDEYIKIIDGEIYFPFKEVNLVNDIEKLSKRLFNIKAFS